MQIITEKKKIYIYSIKLIYQEAFDTPGIFPAVALILKRCLHKPNSENTPPPLPVSVHRFFTAVGRV